MEQFASGPDETVGIILSIARIGESDLAGWWGSHGLDNVGRYVLRGTFRRTWQVAALELDILSAARRHADALGSRATALHLFSDLLPFRRRAVSWLAEQKTAARRSGIFGELEAWTMTDARTWLTGHSAYEPAHEVLRDGLLLGEISETDLGREEILIRSARLLAAGYALLDVPFRAPYLDLRRARM
jgi:hypothetical protein